MQRKILFLLVCILAITTRLTFLTSIPPTFKESVLTVRIISALLNIGSVVFLFIYTHQLSKNYKISLLSSFSFTVLPWTIEQGRIFSESSIAVFLIFLILIVLKRIHSKEGKILFLFVLPLILYFFSPNMWFVKTPSNFSSWPDYKNNILSILSFDFLFFKNHTFWWGGVREYGIIFLPFILPFFLGVFAVIKKRYWSLIIIILFLALIYAGNTTFPEGREFFLATPIISLILGFGFYALSTKKDLKAQIISLILVLAFIYEMMQFFHFYTNHYQKRILQEKEHIYGSF